MQPRQAHAAKATTCSDGNHVQPQQSMQPQRPHAGNATICRQGNHMQPSPPHAAKAPTCTQDNHMRPWKVAQQINNSIYLCCVVLCLVVWRWLLTFGGVVLALPFRYIRPPLGPLPPAICPSCLYHFSSNFVYFFACLAATMTNGTEWGPASFELTRGDWDALELGLSVVAPPRIRTRCHKMCLYQRHRACGRSGTYCCPRCGQRLCSPCFRRYDRRRQRCGTKCRPPG